MQNIIVENPEAFLSLGIVPGNVIKIKEYTRTGKIMRKGEIHNFSALEDLRDYCPNQEFRIIRFSAEVLKSTRKVLQIQIRGKIDD